MTDNGFNERVREAMARQRDVDRLAALDKALAQAQIELAKATRIIEELRRVYR